MNTLLMTSVGMAPPVRLLGAWRINRIQIKKAEASLAAGQQKPEKHKTMKNTIATGYGRDRARPGTHSSSCRHTRKRHLKPSLLALLGCVLLLKPMTATAQIQAVVASNTAFALNLYQELATNTGNIFFSPYSISTCLAMTYAGARGETEAQMAQVLGFGADQQQFASLFGDLQAELEATQKTNVIELNIANALWAQEGLPLLPAFVETATNQYQANVNQIDFRANAEEARLEINNWVAQETRNKIQNILSPGSITPHTQLVLANAIYFLGVWTESFAETNTSPQPFYLSSTNQEEAPLMHQLAQFDSVPFYHMEGNGFQALELPYGSDQASMVILLPSQVDGLAQLEQQLTPSFLSGVLAQMSLSPIEIFLPRFTLGSSFDLADTLAAMGMPDAFAPGVADFSGIDGANNLVISHVVHKAWGQVNEAGTEAAGATVVTIEPTIVWEPPIFRADHPFIFFIRDTQSGSLLFLGRLVDPGQAAANAAPASSPLAITHSGNSLKISWPYPSTGLTLRQSPDLNATNWTPASGVSNDGTNNFITFPASAGNLFFRLSQQ